MSTATISTVCDWNWTSESGYRGKVPTMPKAERQAWVDLNDARAERRLSATESKLLTALDRKIAYRAKKEEV